MVIFNSESAQQTENIGKMLAEILDKSSEKFFIAMYGDLGAGKTPLFHFDLYRIKDAEELDGFGFDEYVDGGNCIAEWSENLGENLPDNTITVKIEKLDENSRRITIEGKREIEDELTGKEGQA